MKHSEYTAGIPEVEQADTNEMFDVEAGYTYCWTCALSSEGPFKPLGVIRGLSCDNCETIPVKRHEKTK